MRLLAPGFLLLLVPVALVAAGYARMQRRRPRFVVRFTAMDLLDRVVPEAPGWRRHLPPALMLAGLLAMVIGLARPVVSAQAYQDAALVVALDVSPSMLARDVAPSRLEAARRALSSFLATAPADVRVGLVEFAGTARVRAAPTTEHARIRRSLERLEVRSETALGEAILTAIDSLQVPSPSQEMAGGVMLLSDGGSTTGPTVGNAIDRARSAGVQVWTVAFGTRDGRVTLGGETIEVPVDGSALEEIAGSTGGRYLEAATAQELGGVLQELRSEIATTEILRELAPWALLSGFALLLAGATLALRWFGRLP